MKPKEKIINVFLKLRKTELYFNELKESSKLSNSSLQNTLKKLESEKIIKSKKTKAHTFYKIENKKYCSMEFAKTSLNAFNKLNRGVRIPLQNFLDKIEDENQIIVLFGSASRESEKDGSDIDILIVSDKKQNYKEIKKEIDSISNYPLSIFECSYEEFLKNRDHIIIQGKETGFPIKGEQQFYEVILNEIK